VEDRAQQALEHLAVALGLTRSASLRACQRRKEGFFASPICAGLLYSVPARRCGRKGKQQLWCMHQFLIIPVRQPLRNSGCLGTLLKDVRDVAAVCSAHARGRNTAKDIESAEVPGHLKLKPLESPPRQNLRGSIRKLEFPKGTLKSPEQVL